MKTYSFQFGITLLVVLILASACSSLPSNYAFVGNWQGNGIDSKGNEFNFAAKVFDLGDEQYKILILDKIDSLKQPLHVINGTLKNNKFTSSADNGKYTGGGVLHNDMYEGFYKGPVNGTYKMWRIK